MNIPWNSTPVGSAYSIVTGFPSRSSTEKYFMYQTTMVTLPSMHLMASYQSMSPSK